MGKQKIKLLSQFLLIMLGSSASVLQQDSNEIISKSAEALQNGDAVNLAKYFYKTIEIDMLGEENFYSQAQSVQLLKNFFEKNKPVKFAVSHQGAKETSASAIGQLQTKGNTFRISIFLKSDGSQFFIHQLRIEQDEEGNGI